MNRIYATCVQCSQRPVAPQGPTRGLPRALDRTGRQNAVHTRPRNLRAAVIADDGGPCKVRHFSVDFLKQSANILETAPSVNLSQNPTPKGYYTSYLKERVYFATLYFDLLARNQPSQDYVVQVLLFPNLCYFRWIKKKQKEWIRMFTTGLERSMWIPQEFLMKSVRMWRLETVLSVRSKALSTPLSPRLRYFCQPQFNLHPVIDNARSGEKGRMSQAFSNNNNSFNTFNYTTADDRLEILSVPNRRVRPEPQKPTDA